MCCMSIQSIMSNWPMPFCFWEKRGTVLWKVSCMIPRLLVGCVARQSVCWVCYDPITMCTGMPNRAGVLNDEQLGVALRALGSLLASGDWDVPGLQNMRRLSEEGSERASYIV